jgi:hypothetical protein
VAQVAKSVTSATTAASAPPPPSAQTFPTEVDPAPR